MTPEVTKRHKEIAQLIAKISRGSPPKLLIAPYIARILNEERQAALEDAAQIVETYGGSAETIAERLRYIAACERDPNVEKESSLLTLGES